MNKSDDLEEEDVWGFPKNIGNSSSKQRKFKKDQYSVSGSSSSSAWRFSTKIPKSNNETKMVQQSSAPMNIPDWSKINGNVSKNGVYSDTYDQISSNGDFDDDEADDEDEMVPPHEWIARRLARSRISSFSVCEGIGRTLKGRDLSKVRNAILTKTGFLEN